MAISPSKEQTTMENKKVLIPNRGVIALDIIESLKSLGLQTILLHSPEDSNTLPVKIADKSYKFYSSKLEDSYLDKESILEKALELGVDYIHPGYGFLSEDVEFAELCEDNNIKIIGPDSKTLKTVQDKLQLKEIAKHLDVPVINNSDLIKTGRELEKTISGFSYPCILKPLKGFGGKGIKICTNEKEAKEFVNDSLRRIINKKNGVFLEEFYPDAHHIEIPFFSDIKGNILLLPEIESSIQRRFQKIFQESPSTNLKDEQRDLIFIFAEKIIRKINYIGLGYIEFFTHRDNIYFSEINPSFQINSLIPEIHIVSNFIKKQFAITNHELLNKVQGTKIIQPKYHIALVSLMAENPYDNFRPSSGTITDFYNYSTIRNIFKTSIHSGARISPLYSPYIGKIISFSKSREITMRNLRSFLNNIYIRGVHTNLIFLKNMLQNKHLISGNTNVNFIEEKCDFNVHQPSESEIEIASAILAASFHIENKKKNLKEELKNMKQPNFIKKILGIS
jgi:acetyl/propionyl-CoA carboxylase alpha subunit